MQLKQLDELRIRELINLFYVQLMRTARAGTSACIPKYPHIF